MASGKMAQKLAGFPKLGLPLVCVPLSDLMHACTLEGKVWQKAEGNAGGELPDSTELDKKKKSIVEKPVTE